MADATQVSTANSAVTKPARLPEGARKMIHIKVDAGGFGFADLIERKGCPEKPQPLMTAWRGSGVGSTEFKLMSFFPTGRKLRPSL